MTIKDRKAHVTGTQVAYCVICRTKLWLFSHFVTMEHTHENVALGKLVHEQSYARVKKEAKIGPIAIDFIRKGEKLVVHEVKKSRKLEEAHRDQLLYYLYVLKRKGIEAMGELDYPLLRKKEEVFLTEEGEKRIEGILQEVERINAMPEPPPPVKKPYCRKCSYFELCWG